MYPCVSLVCEERKSMLVSVSIISMVEERNQGLCIHLHNSFGRGK